MNLIELTYRYTNGFSQYEIPKERISHCYRTFFYGDYKFFVVLIDSTQIEINKDSFEQLLRVLENSDQFDSKKDENKKVD